MDKQEMKQRMKGRTPEQKKVIKYFYGEGGCLSSGLKDEDYDAMVYAKAQSIDFREKALNKIGLDESEVSEIEPVHFEGYWFDEKKTFAKRGNDKLWRSSAYQLTWIFFSSTQIYVYQYTFNMDEDGKKESTEEYFYKDITNFSTTSDTIEKYAPDKVSCKGDVTYARKNVDASRFTITVPGDKFFCSMEQNDYTERAIQGMKAKLREKKG
ncbi:hypothetical protein LJC12_04885 [Odoribacter sp. OttesenSCG-928-J03]|nr:hypothetical protein [Odoribacter sp. OttesenSCG-928-J03]MDL2330636.1 hypothetical protein [Odoribacter sp. OttesenSCG-928-A06]